MELHLRVVDWGESKSQSATDLFVVPVGNSNRLGESGFIDGIELAPDVLDWRGNVLAHVIVEGSWHVSKVEIDVLKLEFLERSTETTLKLSWSKLVSPGLKTLRISINCKPVPTLVVMKSSSRLTTPSSTNSLMAVPMASSFW
ncbi:hypothetical protein GCK72_024754 [Caenorhabditis remanei]|uniref:Uncharacterized protein n=1 Tax=Caenorhabditis remanei TaxID=31234 RepID=A0A6A5G044_CAERE|nr:hypothetical protein GCK72_024754 [Caenorhabditis remanei]KAF1748287.1 hypothetical protein GCK72_024754 [Caenorhabditis remanei]